MLQYLRKVRASFSGGLVINPGRVQTHELMIKFSISKSISSSANTADITLYNLAESTRNGMGKEFDSITLEAGYMPPGEAGNVGVIFKGAIRDVEHRREGPNILTIISCGDGDKALRRATISKSFPAGTPVKDVVDEIAKQMEAEGLARGEFKFPEAMEGKTFKRPYAACGSCARELDTIGRGNGFYYSSQNETLEIIPGDGFVGSVAVISPQTGMIGTPALTDNGVRVSAMLNPEIRPNRRVQIKSETLEMNAADGMYRVSAVTYSGDNDRGDFKVDITGEAIQGGKVDTGVKP
ncbi:MAG: phage protein [Allorhizobium sp.]